MIQLAMPPLVSSRNEPVVASPNVVCFLSLELTQTLFGEPVSKPQQWQVRRTLLPPHLRQAIKNFKLIGR